LTSDQDVAGSSPAGCTNLIIPLIIKGIVGFVCNQKSLGITVWHNKIKIVQSQMSSFKAVCPLILLSFATLQNFIPFALLPASRSQANIWVHPRSSSKAKPIFPTLG
jgi:hypothetical protein